MTALTLTPNPVLGSVTLAITGAPNATPAYTQGTGIDGFTTAAPGSLTLNPTNATRTGAEGFALTRTSSTSPAVASKTIAGLTIGQKYVLKGYARKAGSLTTVRGSVGVSGIGATAFYGLSDTLWSAISYTFTATATSHTIQVQTSGNYATTVTAYWDDISLAPYSVNPTTTVKRTDANGVRDVRRLADQEPVAGVMILTDSEAALTGSVRYDVTDTLGATVSATTNLNAVASPWLTVVTQPPANVLRNPSAEVDVSDWTKTTGNTLTRDTLTVASGVGAFKWVTAAAGDWAYTQDYAASPGQEWVASGLVQGTGSVTVRVTWRDSAGVAITGGESAVLTLTGAWQQISVAAVAPASAAYAFLRFVQKTAGAQTVYFDACLLGQTVGQVHSVTDYGAEREFLGSVHRPIGRKYPLTVTGPLGARRGRFKVHCADYASALEVAAVADSGETLMLRQPTYAGMDMYLAATSAEVAPDQATPAGWTWAVEVAYVELDVPADPLKAA